MRGRAPWRPDGPRAPFEGKRVLLGISGGIAAYKSIQLARDLARAGAEVRVVLTEAAKRFVTPLSFRGVTGGEVYESLWSVEGAARHIQLARESDLVLVAPATADLMARSAAGRADDLLTTVLLATRAPVLMAPAMNDRMWDHPQTRRNAEHLEAIGCRLIGPAVGELAVGESEGPGRMEEPDVLLLHAGRALGTGAPWEGRRVLITSGPTREPLDPVRYLGNRSSGRMGHALAQAAWLKGADVTLVSGPVAIEAPVGVRMISVETAEEMNRAVCEEIPASDVQIFAAAVADFRPESTSSAKIKRKDEREGWSVSLVENPDVAAGTRALRPEGSLTVGFALETDELMERARQKMSQKGFDFIVANGASEPDAGFETATNRVTVLGRDGSVTELPLASKDRVAWRVLELVESGLSVRRPGGGSDAG